MPILEAMYMSPRPLTLIEVLFLSPMSTDNATSFYDYSFSLDLRSLKEIFVPYLPAKGEVLTFIETPINGGSILTQGMTFLGYPYSIAVYVALE